MTTDGVYMITYAAIEPLIAVVELELCDIYQDDCPIDNPDLESRLASKINDYTQGTFHGMLKNQVDVLVEFIRYLIKLSIPVREASKLGVLLYQSLGVALIILEK